MISSGNYGAYYVQHPLAGGGDNDSTADAHAPLSDGSFDSQASAMIGGPSSPGHYRPGTGTQQPMMMRSDEPGVGYEGEHGAIGDQRHYSLPHGYGFSYSGSLPPQHHHSLPGLGVPGPSSPSLAWPGYEAGGAEGVPGRPVFYAQPGGSATSSTWDAHYAPFGATSPPRGVDLSESGMAPLYNSYDSGVGSSMMPGQSYGAPAAPLPGSMRGAQGNQSFLLSQYDLAAIGDDSGSGGMTRPTPKNKRRRKLSDKFDQDEAHGAEVSQSMREPLGVADQNIAQGHSAAINLDTFRGSASDILDELGGIGRLDDVDTNGSSVQDASDLVGLAPGVEDTEEEPFYVNPKQYNRILRRREVRARMEEKRRRTEDAIRSGKINIDKLAGGRELAMRLGLNATEDEEEAARRASFGGTGSVHSTDDSTGASGKRTYQHESRHKHAMRRPRGPGGRFLTAEEIKAKEESEAAEGAQHNAQIERKAEQDQTMRRRSFDEQKAAERDLSADPTSLFDLDGSEPAFDLGQGTAGNEGVKRENDDTYNLLNLE